MREIVTKRLIPNLGKRAAARWARFTEESNRQFQKLSPAKKRVTIAEDVIAQLKAKALIARHGTYVEPKKELNDKRNAALTGIDLSVVIPYFEACDVCAVGSVMICTIMRDDHVTYDGNDSAIDSEVHTNAARFFTEDQVHDMELIFEGWRAQSWSGEDWFPHDLEAGAILTLIMQNVIDSGGSFEGHRFGVWLKAHLTKKKRRAA